MRPLALVYVASAALVLAAAALPSPFLAVLGVETPACDPSTFTFNGSVPSKTVKPVGTDSIRDARHKGVSDGLEQGARDLGLDPKKDKDLAKNIRETVQDVFKLEFDAVTLTSTSWSYSFTRREDQTVKTLTVNWKTDVVILLPENAGAQLTDHEIGHKLIEEKVKDLAKTRFQAAAAGILDQNIPAAQIDAQIKAVAATMRAISQAAQAAYDNATNHGVDGGADQQDDATNAFNQAAAANP